MLTKSHIPFQVKADMEDIPTSDVHVSLDDKKVSIAITGSKEEVKQVARKVHEITKKHEKELIRRKTTIKEPMKVSKKWQIELFGLKGFEKKLVELFEGLNIVLNPAEKTILLEGPTSEISKVKIKIFEEIGKFQTKSKEVSSVLADLAGSKAVMEVLKQQVARYVQAVVEVQSSQIQVHAATKDDATKALAVVERTVCEEDIPVDSDAAEGLESENFQRFCSNCETKNNGKVKIKSAADKQAICLFCTADKKEELSRAIKDFLTKNTFYTTNVQMDYGELRLLNIHRKEELQRLATKHPDGEVCTIPFHSNKGSYTFLAVFHVISRSRKRTLVLCKKKTQQKTQNVAIS